MAFQIVPVPQTGLNREYGAGACGRPNPWLSLQL
jgi:hypothetical protein